MEIAKLILYYLQILLTWPVIGGIIAIVFLKMFREPLSDFFQRIVRGQLYGVSIEASTPSEQQEKVGKEPKVQSATDLETYVQNNPKEAIKEYLKVINWYWFERIYNAIYGTQITLLEHLAVKIENGDLYINLFPFYSEFQNRSKLYNIQMADYLGFLKNMVLIEILNIGTDLKVRITPRGLDFLSYVKGQYPYYKSKTF